MKRVLLQTITLLLPIIALIMLVSSCSKSDSDGNLPSPNILLLRDGFVPDGYLWHFSDKWISDDDFDLLVAALDTRASSESEVVYLEMTNITEIPAAAFEGAKSYFILEAPVATAVGDSAFKGTRIYALLSMDDMSDTAYNFTVESTKSTSDISLPVVNMLSLTTIGNSAFSECDNLVTLSTLATEIGERSFADNRWLKYLEMTKVESIGDGAFADCPTLGTESEIETENLTSNCISLLTAKNIGSQIFEDTPIDSVIIGSLDDITGDSFANSDITSIYLSSLTATNKLNSDEGVVYDGKGLKTILDTLIPTGGEITLDSDTNAILERACSHNTKLTHLTAAGVTTIGANAFASCNLEQLTLATNSGCKLTSIDETAFTDTETKDIELFIGSENSSLKSGDILKVGSVEFIFKSITIQ
ncbi:MAG: leucine-rich repeat protein [Rikenellaceae bacterium]